jgi:beta-lactamase regulating signal transducer with metallopeptidase domain
MNAVLNPLAGQLFGLLGQMGLELAVLALFVLLLGRVLPMKSPSLRHFLWLAVLLKPIVAISISSPWTVFTPLVSPLESSLFAVGSTLSVLPLENIYAATALPLVEASTLSLVGWLAALWVLGVALLMGRIAIGYGVIWRLRRQARLHCDGPLFDALKKARLAIDVHSVAEVATSDSICSPIVMGILRPLIVLPADLLQRLRASELEMILMHELAHVRRYDNLTLLLQRLVAVALFFHPAVWLCGRMLQREAEQACDDIVVNATGRSEEYARGLANVAELANLEIHLNRRIPVMNVFAAAESDLALRIRRSLGGGISRMSTFSRVLAAVLLCGMAAATLPSAGIAQTRDGVDWDTVRSTAPEDWSEELKAQIVAAGHDMEAIAERVRLGQGQEERRERASAELDDIGRRIRAAIESGELTPEEGRKKMGAARLAAGERAESKLPADRIWQAAMATDPAEWSDDLKAAILELKPDSTIEEIAEGIRLRHQHARSKPDKAGLDLDAIGRRIRAAIEAGELTPEEGRAKYEEAQRAAGDRGDDRLREFQRGVIARAMAEAPEDWSDELKAAIARAGWDLDEFSEGIRLRQAGASESTDLLQIFNSDTAVEESSWGGIKKEVGESK